MAWERANEFFPSGQAPLPDGTTMSIEDLKKSEVKVIYKDAVKKAHDMTVAHERYVWGADNEFAKIELYNVYSLIPSPTELTSLNVYGKKMIKNHIDINGIELKEGIE